MHSRQEHVNNTRHHRVKAANSSGVAAEVSGQCEINAQGLILPAHLDHAANHDVPKSRGVPATDSDQGVRQMHGPPLGATMYRDCDITASG